MSSFEATPDVSDDAFVPQSDPNQDKVMATAKVEYADWEAVKAGCKWNTNTFLSKLRPDAFVIDPESEMDDATTHHLTDISRVPVTHEVADCASTLGVPSFYEGLYESEVQYYPSLAFIETNRQLKFFKNTSDKFDHRKASSAVFTAAIHANADAYSLYSKLLEDAAEQDKMRLEDLSERYTQEPQKSLILALTDFHKVSGSYLKTLQAEVQEDLSLGVEPRAAKHLSLYGKETSAASDRALEALQRFTDWTGLPNSHEQLEQLLIAGPVPERHQDDDDSE